MKYLIAALAAFTFSAPAFAQTTAEPETEEQSVVEQLPKNLQDRFSFGVDVKGMNAFTGVGINVETPFAWDFVALRLGISSDRIHGNAAVDEMTFATLQAALKFSGELESTSGVYPYVLIDFNFFKSDENTTGSKSAIGAYFGADWKFVSTPVFQKNVRLVRAFYAEVGSVDSSWTAPTESGSQPISDGFIVRAGFRRYF